MASTTHRIFNSRGGIAKCTGARTHPPQRSLPVQARAGYTTNDLIFQNDFAGAGIAVVAFGLVITKPNLFVLAFYSTKSQNRS